MENKFIPGIYNYCDRWCERCSFTSRCRNYEGTSKLSPEQTDITNKAFWDNISSNFQSALDMLVESAKEHGIDMEQVMREVDESEYKENKLRRDEKIRNHELIVLCKRYHSLARPFIVNAEDFVSKTRELVDELHMGITTEENVVNTVATIGECFEVIQWYLYFIDAKLQRALHGVVDSDEEEENFLQSDSNGSAKIAMIAIEKSMGAWKRLYELMPDSEDLILEILSLLLRLVKLSKAQFPKAMDFVRPGFDD